MKLTNKFEFFLVTPLGFEELAELELSNWLKAPQGLKKINGGIEFTATYGEACALNATLKIPSRILMRLGAFKCRDFPKLFNKISKFEDRGLFIANDFEVVVSTHKSRLNNKKRIQSTVYEALVKKTKSNKNSESSKSNLDSQKIFIRLYDDECFISLDLSGEHLHKRGYKTLTPEAPLRETLASGLIYNLISGFELNKLNEVELIDPMCGSGTFLFEANALFSPNYNLRTYGFKETPVPLKLLKESKSWGALAGFDISSESIKICEAHKEAVFKNEGKDKAEVSNNKATDDFNTSTQVTFKESDVLPRAKYNSQFKKWIICNPPYGERLQVKGLKDNNYNFLIKCMMSNYEPQKLGIILPIVHAKKIKKVNGYGLRKLFFENGGLRVCFLVFEK